MNVSAREAVDTDIDRLLAMYGALEDEMVQLHAMWPIADGLPSPVGRELEEALHDENTILVVGTIDEYPFGFLLARIEETIAGGVLVGSIRLIFVDPEAREVGVGEAMRELVMARLRAQDISKFDAHVLPGHRLVKNFFESGGFSARSIVMHHDDDR